MGWSDIAATFQREQALPSWNNTWEGREGRGWQHCQQYRQKQRAAAAAAAAGIHNVGYSA
jgi:hypothetical protein